MERHTHVYVHGARNDDAFEESQHPRGTGGQFSTAQEAAHGHMTSAGHIHKGQSEAGHEYEHPKSKTQTTISPNGRVHYVLKKKPFGEGYKEKMSSTLANIIGASGGGSSYVKKNIR